MAATLRIPLNALQKAIYERLVADIAGAASVTDAAPRPATYPAVILFGGSGAFGHHSKQSAGFTARPLIRVVSLDAGWLEANTIADLVVAALSRDPLDLGESAAQDGVLTAGDDDSIEYFVSLNESGETVRTIDLRLEIEIRVIPT